MVISHQQHMPLASPPHASWNFPLLRKTIFQLKCWSINVSLCIQQQSQDAIKWI
jgi:hypothetical protein